MHFTFLDATMQRLTLWTPYKIYAESYQGAEHLRRIQGEAQAIVDAALANSS